MTNLPRNSTEPFVGKFAITWPSGFGASVETLTASGVGSGMPSIGYEIAPTLFLVGADGRVRWTDGRGRYKHLEPKQWGAQVEKAIETELAALAGIRE